MRLLNIKHFLPILVLVISVTIHAAWAVEPSADTFYNGRTKLIAQQTTLLKNRLQQAQVQLTTLQHQEEIQLSELSLTQPNKKLRSQAALDIAVAKSNFDSAN